MRGITGVELGPDSCVLVRSGRDGSRTAVSAARTLVADAPERFAAALRKAREESRLPAHARVVAWGVSGGQSPPELSQLPEIGPLVSAGFEIDAIVSPAQAMARLVNARKIETSRTAIAVLSLNTHGVAIAIVSNGETISSRTFAWPLGRPFAQRRDELLDRYLVVSQVAPQLQHVIDLVRPVYGASVASVLVCGNLPNLRSLSMLLIEEMDIEIETLDSTDLLETPDVAPPDAVPSLQLAFAVALPAQVGRAAPGPAAATEGVGRGSALLRRSPLVVALALAAAWSALQLGGASPAAPFFRDAAVLAAAPPPPSPVTAPAPTAPASSRGELRAEATMGRIAEPEPEPELKPGTAEPPARRSSGPARRAEPPPVAAADPPDPLPRVDGIMISGIRRVAIVDGVVVSPGDKVATRTVLRIDREGVVLADANGREVRVAIRMRR